MTTRQPKPVCWVGLAFVLALFIAYQANLGLAGNFGRYHDDTLYFSAAQALAQGRGYSMPSVPENPPHTKYPVLYAWMLSWIWRWQPAFPSSVTPAVWMTVAFACCFLTLSFLLLRELVGERDWIALAVVALCAFEPHFVFMSGSVLSDLPFMTFALAAMLAADVGLGDKHSLLTIGAAGVLAGLSTMIRSVGLPVIAGIVVAAVFRRQFRKAAVFCLAAAPFVVAGILSQSGPALPWTEAGSPGWRQTWLFYTSYLGYWKLSVTNLRVYLTLFGGSIRELFVMPSTYCLFPPPAGGSQLGVMVSVTLSAGILSGMLRQARSAGWKAIHFVFLFYVAAVLISIQAQVDRYLLLFLPLFYGGLLAEGTHLLGMVRQGVRTAKRGSERVVAVALGLILALPLLVAIHHYFRGFRPQLRDQVTERKALAAEKMELYDWIRRNTDPATRFVAYEDVMLYLFTGRQGMRPIELSSAAFHPDHARLRDRELSDITGVARHIHARYWLDSPDDFQLEGARTAILKKASQVTATLPVVFHSSGGRVRLYDLSAAR